MVDREAAARALGGMDNEVVNRRLIAMARSGRLRREAVMALTESNEPTAKAFIAEAARKEPAIGAVVKSVTLGSGEL